LTISLLQAAVVEMVEIIAPAVVAVAAVVVY
jgi:hypothetical protein